MTIDTSPEKWYTLGTVKKGVKQMERYAQLLELLDMYEGNPHEFCEDDAWELKKQIPGIKYNYGASRFCFADPDKDFVLKINYANSDSGNFIDYSAREIDLYEKAKIYHVEKALLPTELYYTALGGIKIYKQQKYTHAIGDLSFYQRKNLYNGALDKTKRIAHRMYKRMHEPTRVGEVWLQCALQVYGKKFMRSFEAYCLDIGIRDLHTANVGFVHKLPVLIDYAGFDG